MERLDNETRKLGLYMRECAIAAPQDPAMAMVGPKNITEAIQDGEACVMAVFVIGDQAFSTRVLDPSQDKINEEAENLLDPMETQRDQIRRAMEEGGDILDIVDPDE